MPDMNETMSQRIALADILNYQSVNNTTVYSNNGLDLSKFKRGQYVASLWTTTAGTGVASFFLNASANANFTGNTNLSGVSTNFNLTANNTSGRVEIRADQLQSISSSYRYVRLGVTTATNACTLSAVGQGSDAAQSPASNQNLNSTFVISDSICSQ